MPKQIHIEPKDEVLLGFLKGLPLFKSLNSEEIQMFFRFSINTVMKPVR